MSGPRRTPLRLAPDGERPSYAELANVVVELVPRVNELTEVTERVEIAVLAMPMTIRAIVREEVRGLPPMRDPSDTQTVFVAETKAMVEKAIERLASESPGPLVEAPPEKVSASIEHVIETQLTRREQAKELARFREKAKNEAAFRSSIKKSVVAGVLTAAVLAVGGYLWGAAEGHADGLVEGKQSAPVLVPVPAPTPVPVRP